MYAALLKQKLVLAVDEAALVKGRKKKLNAEPYYCPRCKKRIILVINQDKAAFFKHLARFTGQMGEKREHHCSKMMLKAALVAAGFAAQTEISLANGGLRADVLASKKLAFEVQCAPLSREEFKHRHQLYAEEKITDVWIVGKRHFLGKKIKKTQLIFFRHNEFWQDYYLEILPQRGLIRLKYNVLLAPISRQLYYQQQNFGLDELGLEQLWKFRPVLKKFSINKNAQKKYLQLQITTGTKMGLKVAQLLYQKGLTMSRLPEKLYCQPRSVTSDNNIIKFLKSDVDFLNEE